jgi:hemerythrin
MSEPGVEQELALVWSERLQIGHPIIDRQHKQLFDLYNQLVNAFYEGTGQQQIYQVVTDLVTYTQHHFRDEERLMAKGGYPELKGHRQQHQELIQQVSSFVADIDESAPVLTYEVLSFVKCWLLEHILEQDMKIKAWLG